MKAVVITNPGGPEVLQWQDYPTPKPGMEEVLIAVKAAGLNRADVSQRKGNYPPPAGAPATIPGLEVAGTVVECGENVTQWKPGDQVCALLAGGGYATNVAVKEGQCLPVPEGWSFAEAACLPETVCTVWHNVFQRGRLQPGENFLVHGGSSGIGITAIQIAKAKGAKVFVTVGSEDKGKACLELGADKYINYKTHDFEKLLSGEGVDVILDMVGGTYLPKNINILHPEGRLVYINSMDRSNAELNIFKVMQKRLTITGSTLRSREYPFKKALIGDVYENVYPLIRAGEFKPVIYKTFPFEQASEAHQLMESSEHIGKIILVGE
jgi:NADPH2:quinone reductase